jgi:hypothetical protein
MFLQEFGWDDPDYILDPAHHRKNRALCQLESYTTMWQKLVSTRAKYTAVSNHFSDRAVSMRPLNLTQWVEVLL